jgi:hypothetical protein
MPYPKNPHLSALWLTDPAKAAATVAAAVRNTKTFEEAARSLGVGRRTLYRWLDRPELRDVREQISGG